MENMISNIHIMCIFIVCNLHFISFYLILSWFYLILSLFYLILSSFFLHFIVILSSFYILFIFFLSHFINILSTFYQHFINILSSFIFFSSSFYLHSINILTTFLLQQSVIFYNTMETSLAMKPNHWKQLNFSIFFNHYWEWPISLNWLNHSHLQGLWLLPQWQVFSGCIFWWYYFILANQNVYLPSLDF